MSLTSPIARLTQLRIEGMRAIDKLTLDLRGLQVLIGDNGSGKSTILDALELLRRIASSSIQPGPLFDPFGRFEAILRKGERTLSLGATVEWSGQAADYDVRFALAGTTARLEHESVLHRSRNGSAVVFVNDRGKRTGVGAQAAGIFSPGPDVLGLSQLSAASDESARVCATALSAMEIHAPFDTRPIWQQRELQVAVGPRWPSLHESVSSLQRYGRNLTNCYQHLRNSRPDVWERVLERTRLGLGQDVADVRPTPAGRGTVDLEIVLRSGLTLSVTDISEGQLSYLCFVALAELHEQSSLLAFDEPELHLHPDLIGRVLFMLEESAATRPVLLATHSDRILDLLPDPSNATLICSLTSDRRCEVRKPDAAVLESWLERYRGLGEIRSAGFLSHVLHPLPEFQRPAPPGGEGGA